MRKYGQSVIDYVVICAIVAAALVGMSRYMSRAVRAHVAKTTDQLGSQTGSMADSEGFVQDSSVMFTEESSQNVVQEQTGGARTTTFDQSSTNYGESISITQEELE